MIRVHAIAEGKTEKLFIDNHLQPLLSKKNIRISSTHLQGNINFDRVKYKIITSLKQDPSVYVTTMLDYYGIDADWPGVKELRQAKNKGVQMTSTQLGKKLRKEFLQQLTEVASSSQQSFNRLIPYFQIHEFEALLFSDLEALEKHTECKTIDITKKLGGLSPEEINDRKESSPKARLKSLHNSKIGYSGVSTNSLLTQKISIEKMRAKCPNFNDWLEELEALAEPRIIN